MSLWMNAFLRFSKYKLHHKTLFYENFITALSTQPVLEYILESLDGMPPLLTLLLNDSPPPPKKFCLGLKNNSSYL